MFQAGVLEQDRECLLRLETGLAERAEEELAGLVAWVVRREERE